jgi:hypothetical protein
MTARPQTILEQLVPLKPLDLQKCTTVNDIVTAMCASSFGARMLGQMADTLTEWTKGVGPRPILIYDGDLDTPLYNLLCKMQNFGWFSEIVTSYNFVLNGRSTERALVVGPYVERHATRLYQKVRHLLYVNRQYQCRPQLVRDGFFPDVLFADPTLAIPLLFLTLRERHYEQKADMQELMKLWEERCCATRPARSCSQSRAP